MAEDRLAGPKAIVNGFLVMAVGVAAGLFLVYILFGCAAMMGGV
jgi:hypothetical protein